MPRGNVESVQNDFSNDDVKIASVRLRRRRCKVVSVDERMGVTTVAAGNASGKRHVL